MLKKLCSGIAAGVCICLGGSVFLACENRIVGAVLFSVALLCICLKGYALFTGKVGYVPEAHDQESVSVLLLALLGNAIGTVAGGYLIRAALPNLGAAAETICLAKLNQVWWATLVRGCFCGVLMYLAVSTYRDNKTPLGILFCIPVFILSGFEHSIADIFYFAASGIVSLPAFGFLWLVIIGNAIGGMLLPLLNGLWKKGETTHA
ncbi:MAG: formate/nitrite transporter family protein [Clostridia bacterium]|nr:formate/nitrite transporter family protein [Clostridia bacterium]